MAIKAKAISAQKKRVGFKGFLVFLRGWLWRNKVFFVAFAIPAILTYVAYAIFGLYPFGGQSVLCLDLNGQYVYYFEAIRDAFWGDGSIFYNWARNLSGGYMGVIGYYLASPFTLIVVLLPERFMIWSLLIMQLCKLGCAGVTFSYYLQKSKGVGQIHSLIFSTMYAMMAYAVIQLIDPMWLDGLVFLPLIILGIEYLVDDGRRLNYIIPLAIMCVANFYIGYMICIFVALYFFFYLFFGTDQKGRKPLDFVKSFVRIAYSSIIALACAAFMLLPVYNALRLGKFDFTDPDYTFRFQSFPLSENLLSDANANPLLTLLLDLLDMFPQFLPAQYDSVNVQGKPEIYCGLLTVVLLPLFYMNSEIPRWKKSGYTLFIFTLLACMMVVPIDMWWHGGQSPNWLPFRYSFVLSFLFLTMGATAFAHRRALKGKHLLGSLITMIVLIAVVAGMNFDQMARGAVWISAGFALLYLIFLYFLCVSRATKNKKGLGVLISLLLIAATGAEATYNAVDSMRDIDEEVAYSTRASYLNFIQNGRAATDAMEEYDSGFYRSEKTFFRCVNDNAAFGIKGISHSSSVMNSRILTFLETLGYSTKSYYSRYDGNTPLADSLLGIKYVMDRGDAVDEKRLNSTYEPVLYYDYVNENDANKTITIYQNPNALSIGYMVDEDTEKIDHLGNDNPFNSQNIFLSTMAGQTTFTDDGDFESWNEYYTPISLAEDAVISSAVNVSPYGEQTMYESNDTGDPTVDFHIEVTEEMAGKPIYIFFKTEFQHQVNLYLYSWSTDDWQAAEDTYLAENPGATFTWSAADEAQYGYFDSLGNYFEDDNYCIRTLGTYDAGTRLTLRMTISDYTIVKNFLFYTFDEEAFEEDIAVLKANQWQLSEDTTERRLTGTVTAEEGQILLTSIPYEPGWTVQVDGQTVDNLIVEGEDADGNTTVSNEDGDVGQIVVADALIGIRLPAGEHTVTMKYTPPGWWLGIGALCAGIAVMVFLWFGDRKRYALMIAEKKRLAELAQKQQQERRARLRSKQEKPVDLDSKTDLLANIDALYKEGILSEEEYNEKRAKLISKEKEPARPDLLANIDALYKEGILSEEEYKQKRALLEEKQKK